MKRHNVSIDIEPCPFCGSRIINMYSHMDTLSIVCICGAQIRKGIGIRPVDDKDIQELIYKWNTRIGGTEK